MYLRRGFLLLALITVHTLHLHADSLLPNGGFESGNFTGWSNIGDALVVGSTFGNTPASGNYQAMITTAPGHTFFPTEAATPPNNNGTFSGSPAVGAFSFFNSPLTDFLGLPGLSLLNFGQAIGNGINPTWEGSAIQTTFSGNSGDVLSFNWDFTTNESLNDLSDFAFGVLDGNIFLIGGTAGLFSQGSTSYFVFDSGYQQFAMTLPTNGTHTLAFGIVDGTIDPLVDSALLVDNVSLAAPVPEPSTLLLLGSGLVGIGLWKRRRVRRGETAG